MELAEKALEDRRLLRWHWLILFFLLLTLVLLRILFFVGIGANDDVAYFSLAESLSHGVNIIADGGNQLGFRLGMIVPLAALYKFFGFGEWSTCLYPLMCSVLTCLFLYLAGREVWGSGAGLAAAVLWIVFPLQMVFDTQLSPSNQHATCVAACVYFFLKGSRANVTFGFTQRLLLILSGMCLGFGWMVNEIFALMVIGGVVFLIIGRPQFRPVFWALLGFFVVFTGDFVITRVFSGGWFDRVHSIAGTEAEVVSNVDMKYFPRVLFEDVADNFVDKGGRFGVFWYVFVIVPFWALFRKDRESFWMSLSAWAVLAYLQYGVTPGANEPIAKYIRYLSMLVPLQCLSLAGLFAGEQRGRIKTVIFSVLAVVLCVHLFICGVKSAQAARIPLEDFRLMTEFFEHEGRGLPVYADETSAAYMHIYSSGRIGVKAIHLNNLEMSPPERGFVVTEGTLGYFELDVFRLHMPEWYRNPPSSWQLVYVVRADQRGSAWESFDPKIYLVSE